MTLPLIALRDQLSEPETARLQSLFEEPDLGHGGMLLEWLDDSGALQQARQAAEMYAEQAAGELVGLRESEAKWALAELARFVVARNI